MRIENLKIVGYPRDKPDEYKLVGDLIREGFWECFLEDEVDHERTLTHFDTSFRAVSVAKACMESEDRSVYFVPVKLDQEYNSEIKTIGSAAEKPNVGAGLRFNTAVLSDDMFAMTDWTVTIYWGGQQYSKSFFHYDKAMEYIETRRYIREEFK